MLRIALLCFSLCILPVHAAEVEAGTDRPGGDYKRIEMAPGMGGFASCQSACAADATCKAWTFVKSGVQGPKAQCYLKGSVPNAFSNNCCTSGVKGKPVRVTGRPKVGKTQQEINDEQEKPEDARDSVDSAQDQRRKGLDAIKKMLDQAQAIQPCGNGAPC